MTETLQDRSRWIDSFSIRQKRIVLVWIAVAIAAGLIRMFVVGQDGIVLLKFDAGVYAQSSVYYMQDSEFTTIPAHRPGLPIIAWLVRQFGAPYKMALDGMLMLTALLSGIAFTRLVHSQAAGIWLFLVFMFNPWFMPHSRMFMTEPLVALVFMLQLLSAIPFVVRPVNSWTLWSVIPAAFVAVVYALTRNETYLLGLFWLMVWICVVVRQKLFRWSAVRQAGWRTVCVILPIAIAWLSVQGVRRSHESRFGVDALCATEAPGIVSLINALYSIAPTESIRFAPVTRDTLAKACAVSPTLALYQDSLLDENRAAYAFCKEVLDLDSQVGTWLNWHLVDCFGGIKRHTNHQMAQAAREIRQAQRAGKLPDRMARYPIDPLWREWLPELPSKMYLAVARSLNRQLYRLDLYFAEHRPHNTVSGGFFDDGLLRRNSILLDRNVRIYGQVLGNQTQVQTVRITSEDGNPVLSVPVLTANSGERYFSISIQDIENPLADTTLFIEFLNSQGQSINESPIELAPEFEMRFVPLDISNTNPNGTESWMMSGTRNVPGKNIRRRIQRRLTRYRLWTTLPLFLLAFVGGWWRHNDRRAFYDAAWIAAIAIAIFLLRCLFYSLIDAWLRWGLSRYVEPNVFVALFGLGCLAFVAGVLCRRVQSRFRARDTMPATSHSA